MKILVVHASAGAGHMKAAEAIFDGLKKHTQHDITFLDCLDKSYPLFKKMYRQGYAFMITKVPSIWALAFAILDISWMQPVFRSIRRVYNAINIRNFEKYLVEEQFDCIFSAHFMPNEVVSAVKKSGKIHSKLISTVTDYDVHKIWVGSEVDIYCVACEDTKKKLASFGVDESKVVITGIPTNEKFSGQPDIPQLKKKLGVKEDVFTVLMATGSFGIGPIEEIIKAVEGEFQVIVVSGHNKHLYETLTKKAYKGIIVLGLVDNMHELMAVSDVMVTKPGGLSISEALVSQLPLIFFNPIPGQEIKNIKVLGKYGIGIKTDSVSSIVKALTIYRSSKDTFLTALKRTKELARPNAVKDIISLIS